MCARYGARYIYAFYCLLHGKLQGFSSSFLRFICRVGSCDCFNSIVLFFSATLFHTILHHVHMLTVTVYIPQTHTLCKFLLFFHFFFRGIKKAKTHPPEVIYYSSTNNCACVIIIPYIQREGEAEITIHGVCVCLHVMYFIYHVLYIHGRVSVYTK